MYQCVCLCVCSSVQVCMDVRAQAVTVNISLLCLQGSFVLVHTISMESLFYLSIPSPPLPPLPAPPPTTGKYTHCSLRGFFLVDEFYMIYNSSTVNGCMRRDVHNILMRCKQIMITRLLFLQASKPEFRRPFAG